MPKVKSVKSTGSGHAATTKPNHHTRVPAALKHIPAQFLQSWGDRSYQKGGGVLTSLLPLPLPTPPPPPLVRRPDFAPPQGWKVKKACHPTLQSETTVPPPSPPRSPKVKKEDIDCGVAGLEGRFSDYQACKSERRDDSSTYNSSRSASPETLRLPGIMVTNSDSMSPSPPSSPLTPPQTPPLVRRPFSSPVHDVSSDVLKEYPTQLRAHRRSHSHPYTPPPQSNCGAGRPTLFDAISRRQLPPPDAVDQWRVVKCEPDGQNVAPQSRYDWRDLRAPRDSISVAATEHRYSPYSRRSPTPVLPELDLPSFVEKNRRNGPVPLPSFYVPAASEEPPSVSHRQTSHSAYFSD
ncbi:hypothetical protein K466DRAFT_569104 [Polyporus arcularius HHB13444]|uniref:Uncharacterized protein n=1 Tax=Polyporus arcularius HHB13444 TaxID=1314778 RepID=A0A5C3NX09_9APHY|nr:hypothetical protein K466DRAFT_569104 [Polyporus arcularius HHB13444]